MNWSEPTSPLAAASADAGPEAAPDCAPACASGLFAGDCGELALETRRALVQLLAGPALDARRHPRLWPVLLRDEALLRRRLAELFLELVIDRELQVAFTRQADCGELEAPTLLRRVQLTFIDSVLLLHLRQRLTQADAQGERAAVAADEMLEFMSLYERAASTDRAGFIKRVQASIEKLKKHNILHKIRGSDERFEVAPTLKLLFSADEILALTRLYQRMAAGEAIAPVAALDADEETDA